ncbi:uncharacterized protein LOC128956638 [Oppia nitens]|uniref:uncharacterized protein LOC128956638 n=1 Tax=Oppia nitens TaxID=1686743 RepID=UPI0023D9D8F1|nr:uncharacterized protein LOC128956638 [Oppia nitens]
MCEQIIGENEILSTMNNKTLSSSMVTKEVGLCQSYERRMTEYMTSVPHIPPTLFELRLRHNEIKTDIIRQYKNNTISSTGINNKQSPPSTAASVSKLDNLIEKVYQNLAKKNIKEYKTCQAGFIIGWKCNTNKPSKPTVQSSDDRF